MLNFKTHTNKKNTPGPKNTKLARLIIIFSSIIQIIASNVESVNPMIGTAGKNIGGMIPSVAPPFAMTRWTPVTKQNVVGITPLSVHILRHAHVRAC